MKIILGFSYAKIPYYLSIDVAQNFGVDYLFKLLFIYLIIYFFSNKTLLSNL